MRKDVDTGRQTTAEDPKEFSPFSWSLSKGKKGKDNGQAMGPDRRQRCAVYFSLVCVLAPVQHAVLLPR
jgi:hypothetical protein